jgi:hypothetical protein
LRHSTPSRHGSTAATSSQRHGSVLGVTNRVRSTWRISVVACGAPAIDSAGIAKPARIYDIRSTFISNALANGLTVFETARVAGTSVKMIEAHYSALIDTARESLLERLEGALG